MYIYMYVYIYMYIYIYIYIISEIIKINKDITDKKM